MLGGVSGIGGIGGDGRGWCDTVLQVSQRNAEAMGGHLDAIQLDQVIACIGSAPELSQSVGVEGERA